MSQEKDDRYRNTMMDSREKFLESERTRSPKRLSEEGWREYIDKIQSFIEESGLTMVVLVEFPDGGFIQLNNRGLPTVRGVGLLQLAMIDHQAGVASHRVLEAMRLDREFGKIPLDEQGTQGTKH